MANPPRQLQYAGWLLAAAFVSPFLALPFVYPHIHAVGTVVSISYLVFYVPACVLLGVAANKMQRSWVLYGALPILGYGGGLLSFWLLKYFRHSRRGAHGA